MSNRFQSWFFPHDNKPDHFKSLDGLRGIAVLLVLLSHSSNMGLMFLPFLNFSGMGKIGVYLFFVLSAYLLDRQIALAFINQRSSKKFWLNYFLRRFLRIYPLFLISVILTSILFSLGLHQMVDKPLDIPMHMVLMKGESIFWSIPVEFKYYFLSPLIMWFCNRVLKWKAIAVLALFLALTTASVLVEYITDLPLISTFRFLPIFLVGTVISIFELIRQEHFRKFLSGRNFDLIGALAALLILISIPFYFKKIFGFGLFFHDPIFYLPYAGLWGIILLSAKYGQGIIRRFMELRFLRFIGTISFSMYLFHLQILYLVRIDELGIPPNLQVYAFFLLSILVSSISFLLIEKPLSGIRIKF